MTDKEAVEAVREAIRKVFTNNGFRWLACEDEITKAALAAARPHILEEAARIADCESIKAHAFNSALSEGRANAADDIAAAIRHSITQN